MKRTHSEMADIMQGMGDAKEVWLRVHGPKRGEMDRAQRQIEMEACRQAERDYRAAAQRKENAA